MSDNSTEYKLKGRQIVYVPNLNQKKMIALNEHAEPVTEEVKRRKTVEIKANNKKLATAARKTRAKK